MKISTALKALAGAAVVMLPLTATAESNFQTGAAALTSTAHVDFQVTIPKILYLRVGTGSSYPTAALRDRRHDRSDYFRPYRWRSR